MLKFADGQTDGQTNRQTDGMITKGHPPSGGALKNFLELLERPCDKEHTCPIWKVLS